MSSPKLTGIRLLAAALLLVPSLLAAQLPPAAGLMAAHNQAIGSEAAVAAFQGVHIAGSFAMPGATAPLELWGLRPNRMVSRVNQFAGGQEQVFSIEKLEAYSPEPGRFDLPAEIKALVK